MFENVLIAEDQEMMNLSLQRTLGELEIGRVDHAFYCDQALAKVRSTLRNSCGYDLLVTDLYFETEGTSRQIPEGMELIAEARAVQPALKVLVFSAESRVTVIRSLFDEFHIDGYVRKARGDARELKAALERISRGRRFYPVELRSISAQENLHLFTPYDKVIIGLLADGYAQKDIPAQLGIRGIRPAGLSSVEKRLNLIKSAMRFSKNEQLVAFCKEMMLI
ncbi:MAG: response regulator [Mucilaginibacter sp.]|uniref:response regulator n=1 Tax=Mucilaginibacter sp. TaxID=1882438 RepID=UPI0031AB990C